MCNGFRNVLERNSLFAICNKAAELGRPVRCSRGRLVSKKAMDRSDCSVFTLPLQRAKHFAFGIVRQPQGVLMTIGDPVVG